MHFQSELNLYPKKDEEGVSLKKTAIWISILILTLVSISIGFIIWAETPLGPAVRAHQALNFSANITVENGKWLTITPAQENPTTGLILYPGGRVDPASYLPIAGAIAEEGYQVVIVPMPLNLAVFNPSAASQVIAAYPEIDHWAVGGHSLGGAMAAKFAGSNPTLIEGLVLWAAYPATDNDLAQKDLKVVSIFGSQDGLATGDKIDASRKQLPPDTSWVQISGGNHAQFGDYGQQSGDNPASISLEEQQAQAVQATVDLLASLGENRP